MAEYKIGAGLLLIIGLILLVWAINSEMNTLNKVLLSVIGVCGMAIGGMSLKSN